MRSRKRTWISLAGVTLAVAAAAVGLLTARQRAIESRASQLLKARADAIVVAKGESEGWKAGRNAEAAIGASESRVPDATAEVQAYQLRAYPEAEVPGEATLAARNGWVALSASAHSAGSWQLIGPSKATYPSVLNPFLFDGAPYVASGRVTAMAIGPTCRPGACPLYVAAAGGGVWKARDALAGSPNWQYLSAAFGTNAIGSLLMDRRDPSGNTLYAGTGEPNASGDSEAGRWHLQDHGRRTDLEPRPRQRRLLPAGDRADGHRQRREPPGPDRQRRARHQLRLERRIVERRNRASPSRTRPLAAERRRVHAHPAARRRGHRPRLHDRPGRPHASRRHLRQRVLPGDLALVRQRRHLGSDQDAAQCDPQHRPGRVRRHDLAQRQHADVRGCRQPERLGREPGSLLSHRRCHRVHPYSPT